MIASGSAADPYVTHEASDPTIAASCRSIDGLTQVSPLLVGGETTAIIVVGGQSLMSNYTQTAYTPTNAKVQVLNIYNGGVYQVNGNPLPGANNTMDCFFKRVADKMITAGKYARVILVPVAWGSMYFADFASGGQMNHRFGVAAKRLAALNLTATHICWGQGESDNAGASSQATCSAGISSIITNCSAAFGVSVPFYLATESYYLGATAANVTNAQAAAIGGNVKAGPNMDSIGSSGRYDNIHPNATGADTAAGLWNAVLP